MSQRSCTASPASASDRRLAALCLGPKGHRASITCNSSHLSDGAQSLRVSVIAAAGAHPPAAAIAARELRGARAPSQLAEDLYQYATASTAAGRRPGNDAFLAACLSDLSAPHRLRRLRPRQLATLLRSLVHLGAHPGEDWLADLDMCCYCHPGPFDPASATTVLQALAALQTTTATLPSTGASLNSTSSSGPSTHGASDTDDNGAADACAAYWGKSPKLKDTQAQRRGDHGKSQAQLRRGAHYPATAAAASSKSPSRRPSSAPYTSSSSSFWTSTATFSSEVPPALSSAAAIAGGDDECGCDGSPLSSSSSPAAGTQLRFPQAVYLRLIQGGVYNYTYEQLATLLQSFRSLGVAISDEEALMVGSRMASLLLEMGPEQRQRALAAVLGTA